MALQQLEYRTDSKKDSERTDAAWEARLSCCISVAALPLITISGVVSELLQAMEESAMGRHPWIRNHLVSCAVIGPIVVIAWCFAFTAFWRRPRAWKSNLLASGLASIASLLLANVLFR